MNRLETYQDFIDSLVNGGIFTLVKCSECGWESIISPRIKDRYFCSKCGCDNKKEEK